MPTLSITKTYANDAVLSETDLDNIKNSVETFLNTTKIDSDNIQTGGVATAAIANGAVTAAKLASGVAIPPGAMMDFGGTSAPTGWLLCDGTAVSRTTYADLFSAISTNYGVGDGATTFNVPDFRGRTAVGTGTGSGLTARSIGATVGAETLPAHTHSITDPGHAHAQTYYTAAGSSGNAYPEQAGNSGSQSGSFNTGSSTTGITATGSTGTGSHGVMQPSLVATKIIKT